MTQTHRLAVIPGDGIGREVTDEALKVLAVATPAEPFELAGREVWVYYGDGQAKSRLGATFSRVVGVSATTRTVGTVSKVVAKIEARAADGS